MERFQKKYLKVETVKADIYMTNDMELMKNTSKKLLACLVDQINSPSKSNEKRKSDGIINKKS